MSGDGEDADGPFKHLKDSRIYKTISDSYNQIQRMDTETFIPFISSFGFILYCVGIFLILLIVAGLFIYQIFEDGFRPSDVDTVATNLLVGLGFVYIVIYQIASHINLLTGADESKKDDDIFSGLQSRALVVFGLLFLSIAVYLRIELVPGLNIESFGSDPLVAIGAVLLAISVDFVYFGMLLVGLGITVRALYNIYREEEETEQPNATNTD